MSAFGWMWGDTTPLAVYHRWWCAVYEL